MNNYKELSELYKPKFLNYIIHRAKERSRKKPLENYEDLCQEGLLRLVQTYKDNPEAEDALVMSSLKRRFNDINKAYSNRVLIIPLEEVKGYNTTYEPQD